MNAKAKSTVEEIRARFDADVERFSNLETGQSATIDAPLVMSLVTQAAAAINPNATGVLDIGCGAGNYTLKLLQEIPNFSATLIDLSEPMLRRAHERVQSQTAGTVTTLQADVRELDLGEAKFDIVTASAVLHHLRTDQEWTDVFSKVFRALKPGGSFWIADLIEHTDPRIQTLMWRRYGDYLKTLGGEEYREKVYTYVDAEDTPKPLMYQLDLLRRVGFAEVDVLHKNSVFAAFGGIKGK